MFSLITFSVSGKNNKIIDSLQNVLKIAKYDTTRVNALNELAWELKFNNSDSAIILCIQALKLSEKIRFQSGIASSYRILGISNDIKGNYSQALQYHFKALEVYKRINHKRGILNTLGNIGIIYAKQGNYPKALDYFFKALRIAEGLGNKPEIARDMGNIGSVFESQGDYPKALEYFSNALKIDMEIGNKGAIIAGLGSIGNVYTGQGNYSMALEYFFKALKRAEEIDNKNSIAIWLGNIGNTYFIQGDNLKIATKERNKLFNTALEYSFKALKKREEIGDQQLISTSLCNIGKIYTARGNYSEAEKYLQKSLVLAEKTGSLMAIKTSNENLSILYSETQQPAKAFESFKKYIIAKDSIFNQENTKKTVRAEMNFEFDKKEQITKLEQDKKDAIAAQQNTIQSLELSQTKYLMYGLSGFFLFMMTIVLLIVRQNKLQSKQRTIQLEQQLLRSQMNPHFIFNSLIAIESFIYKNEPKEAGKYLSGFARLMRMILENSRVEYISLAKEIKTLEHYLELQKLRFEEKFNYSIAVEEGIDIENIAIPPMLAQPFIENSIEHGIKDIKGKGKIDIRFSIRNNQLVFELNDNGIGIDKTLATKQGKKTHQSLATTITSERLATINKWQSKKITLKIGDLKDSSNTILGTQVSFTVPFKEM